MVASLICLTIVVVLRISAGVYQDKFTFLKNCLVPLNWGIAILAVIFAIFVIIKIVNTARRK